jgi:Tfp pilus assembly protein PilX
MCVGGGDTSGNTGAETGLLQDPRGEYRFGGGYSAQTQSSPSTGTYFSGADEETRTRAQQLVAAIDRGSGEVIFGGANVKGIGRDESDSGNAIYFATTSRGRERISANQYRNLEGAFRDQKRFQAEAETARKELESLTQAEASRQQRAADAAAAAERQRAADAAAAAERQRQSSSSAPTKIMTPTPKPTVIDSRDRLPTNVAPGALVRGPQPQTGASGFYDQERGRMDAAQKATGVIQARGRDEPNYPSMPELRDQAIRSIQQRIDNRENPPPLLPGAGLITGLNAVGNIFAERMIRSLRDGNDPVYSSSGQVTGTKDPSTDRLIEGQSDLLVDGVYYNTIAEAQRAQRKKETEEAGQEEAKEERPESATNPVEIDGNRRSMLAMEQARSPSRSRGPGRRSLFGTA